MSTTSGGVLNTALRNQTQQVPGDSGTHQFRVAVIIPALNEELSIGRVLADFAWDAVDEVIVVDNGSIDRTAEVAREGGARVLVQPERGYGAACLAGLCGISPQIDIIVFLDADYSDFPDELPQLIKPITDGRADLVIGSRMLGRSSRQALRPQQRWGNSLATRLIRWRWKFAYTDLGPFRAIRSASIAQLNMMDRNFGWTVEMQIKAILAGLRILEVPVRYRTRLGRSKISGSVRGVLGASAKIVYTISRFMLSRHKRLC